MFEEIKGWIEERNLIYTEFEYLLVTPDDGMKKCIRIDIPEHEKEAFICVDFYVGGKIEIYIVQETGYNDWRITNSIACTYDLCTAKEQILEAIKHAQTNF